MTTPKFLASIFKPGSHDEPIMLSQPRLLIQTKLKVSIFKPGSHNEAILQMVASHNAGLCIVRPEDIAGYCHCRAAQFPSIHGKTSVVTPNSRVHVWVSEDDCESFTLFIEEVDPSYFRHDFPKKEK